MHRELHFIHEVLENFESPLWAGRLPLRVGEPAGGSLTVDEYKFAVTGPWAIIIPMIWDKFRREAESDHKKAVTQYKKKKKDWEKEMEEWEEMKETDPPVEPKQPKLRMQTGEDENFLRFATALKIMVGSSIRHEGVTRPRSLLEAYLLGFSQLYGSHEMKPNHHWAVHIPDQILDYGPVYTFWAFLTERLNKVLKNLNSNNWTGGRLEVSMMREFHRAVGLDAVMRSNAQNTKLPRLECDFNAKLLAGDNTQALGTIQDAAQAGKAYSPEIRSDHARAPTTETLSRAQAGTIAKNADRLSDHIRFGLKQYYNRISPQVHFPREETALTYELHPYGVTYNFVLLDGRRIIPTSSQRSSGGSSIIQARFGDLPHVGEIRQIFLHRQPGVADSEFTLLAAVAWMKPSKWTPLDNRTLWNKFPELGIETWELNSYVDFKANDPPMIIRVEDIHCQVARALISHTTPKIWITTTMDRFPTSLNAFGFGDIQPEE
ncbi:hypothetical protein C8R44DRAFT_880917 [Mycena epipterygia]|nr:hypothetical protein C8R44DRAFT_880917 [Mycena epipterygia]